MRAALFCLAALAAFPQTSLAANKREQLVIISFDGAHDNALWTKSRDMAKSAGAHFTYFLSCTFLMSPAEQRRYQGPHEARHRSNIGFAQSEKSVRLMLDNVWQAHLEGNDIGSHACGHFDGGKWSKADWLQEFASFHKTLLNAWKENGLTDEEPKAWSDFVDHDIKGFRAPYLSINNALPEAEKEAGYVYDASLITRGPAMPKKDGSLTRFGLPLIPEGPENRRIIAMDYNLFVRHSGGHEDSSRSAEFEERAYKAFRAAFDRQYNGQRIPLQFGFHFVEMNGGAYWRALERIVSDVCTKPDVACVSYSEAIARLNDEPKMEKADSSAF
jgi:peptidoglycan/xylan/chitin deacetylase (PgdA/CDA1 family)